MWYDIKRNTLHIAGNHPCNGDSHECSDLCLPTGRTEFVCACADYGGKLLDYGGKACRSMYRLYDQYLEQMIWHTNYMKSRQILHWNCFVVWLRRIGSRVSWIL